MERENEVAKVGRLEGMGHKQMKILVTGGAGFIGSHVSQYLVQHGHQVTIVDELNDFYSPIIKRANLEAVRTAGQVAFHQANICDETAMSVIAEKTRPDAIIHLAARAGVRPSIE